MKELSKAHNDNYRARANMTELISIAQRRLIKDNPEHDSAEKILLEKKWYNDLSKNRKMAILDMAFNLGILKTLTLEEMIGALESKDYFQAAREMLNSGWPQEYDKKALMLARMMRFG